jgi:hypothetical protein
MPKYWLDGIFEEIKYSNIPKQETIILCSNFKYCEEKGCSKKHWFNIFQNEKTNFFNRKEELIFLRKTFEKYRKEGHIVIVE